MRGEEGVKIVAGVDAESGVGEVDEGKRVELLSVVKIRLGLLIKIK